MYKYQVKKTFEIDAAHRLDVNYESKCKNLHGHQWIIEVTLESDKLDENGMVMDFGHIKSKVKDILDHRIMNDVLDFNPTAENLARWILDMFPLALSVSVQESPGSVAVCYKVI